MLKLNKILLKKGIKSLFSSKIFSILVMLLILISGTTYTMLESSSSSFKTSYNNSVVDGKLHDAVLKSGFRFSKKELADGKFELETVDSAGHVYKLDEKDPKTGKYKNLYKTKKSQANPSSKKEYYEVFLQSKKFTSPGIYSSLQGKSFDPIKVYASPGTSEAKIIADLKAKITEVARNATESVEKALDEVVVKKLRAKYGTEMFVKSTKSIYVTDNERSFKVVSYDSNDSKNVNKMVVYDGTEHSLNPLSRQKAEEIMDDYLLSENKNVADFFFSNTKGYRYYKNDRQGIDTGASVLDPSSITAVVSPAFANKNNKSAMSLEMVREIFADNPKLFDDLQSKATKEILDEYSRSIIFVSGVPFFITGIGSTPDFAYPIIDKSMPIVDTKTQAIVFTTKKGFQRIEDGFRTNPRENYISLKFKDGVSDTRRKEILDEVELLFKASSASTMPRSVYPGYIKLATDADDTDEQIILSANRTEILRTLSKTISTLSYTTTTLLIAFLSAIVLMVFKVLVSGNRKVYATMHALGYSKIQISLSNAIASLPLVLIPSILSYAIGYGLQFPFTGNFSEVWTIPSYETSFSWISLLIIIGVPLLLLFTIIFLITLYEMRFPIPSMLNDVSVERGTKMPMMISRLKIIGIKTKYMLGLTFKNLDKLLLVMISSLISISSLVIGFGTIGRADQAYNATQAMVNYEFAVDLVTPTKEGGQYETRTRSKLPGITSKAQATSGGAEWHVPKQTDFNLIGSKAQNNVAAASLYLKNKLQNPTILQENNLSGFGAWDLAKRLMPENQLNQSKESMERLKGKIKGQLVFDTTIGDYTTNFKRLFNHLTRNKNAGFMPFILSYNQVIIDETDEKYTYIDSIYDKEKHPFKITGLNEDTKMVKLKTELKELKSSKEALPILINKYIAEKFNLSAGSTIDLTVSNHTERNYSGSGKNQFKVKAKVIKVVDGYNQTGIYTLQEKANALLGLNTQNGFNGIFSKEEKPAILTTLPLYAESGIYPGTDSYSSTDWQAFLTKYLQTPEGKKLPVKTTREFISLYSETPYSSSLKKVAWNDIDKATFKNTSNLASAIITVVESISIILSSAFMIIVATLMFKANKKKIATLWTLGYRKREVAKIFLSMYILPILLSFAIALPLSFGILAALRLFIINFGNILIPFAITWWMPILAVGIIAVIITVSTLITIFTQRQNTALEAFKGD